MPKSLTTVSKQPDSIDLSFLDHLSEDQLREMFMAQQELERRLIIEGPQNDDELHKWLIDELGINIPRESVCDDHDPPFKFLSDLYFERVNAALVMANRGGAKTFIVAVLHWLNSKFKPGCESCTFGATEAQSLRCYAHLKGWIYDDDGQKRGEIAASIMRETTWRNGSKVEVLPGTPQAVNGPHPQKAHADEIELMDETTWSESRNMTISKVLPNGNIIPPQDIATSTRKGPNGRMQFLIDEIESAIRSGYAPPRTLYQWCIKETAAQVKNCQVANPMLEEGERCQCDQVRKGIWDDHTPRLLIDICKGDFFRSRGWQPYGDIVKQFRENDRETFEVQQLCSKPEMQHHYLPTYAEERQGIRNYDADPDNGSIYQTVDWGGTNPHAVNWYQLLDFEIEVEDFFGFTKRLRQGTVVCFDEIYISEIGNDKLADLVVDRESRWRRKWTTLGKTWRVEDRFADPQGKAARTDWKDHDPPLPTTWHTTREFDEHVKACKNLFEDDLFAIDVQKCPNWSREAKGWRRDPKSLNQVDKDNHCMSNFRYAIANIRKLKRKRERTKNQRPKTRSIPRQTQAGSGGSTSSVRFGQQNDFAQWRKSLGEPLTKVRNR